MIEWTSIFLEVNCNFYKMSPILCPVSLYCEPAKPTCVSIISIASYIILQTATILVLYNAGPLDVSWAVSSDKVVAILESFLPGQVTNYKYIALSL